MDPPNGGFVIQDIHAAGEVDVQKRLPVDLITLEPQKMADP